MEHRWPSKIGSGAFSGRFRTLLMIHVLGASLGRPVS